MNLPFCLRMCSSLWRTPDNLKLRSLERREIVGLAFNAVSWHTGPAGLLRDVDAGRVGYTGDFQNIAGHDAVSNSAGHF